MAYPGGGLYVVEGEVCLLITAMRRGTRWSSHSHQDDDQGTLIKGLFTLKEGLNEAKDLSYLEPSVFLAPFLEIIRSEETTGPVTSLALSAVNKMISYGLIDSDHPAIAQCVEAIADVVTHARFVGTDASGDGVVLMRILQVLRALMLSPAGDYLSNESICEIMLSCFRICFETRLSELLRKTAEHCLRDMVQHLFTRLPQFADDTRVLLNMKKMRTNGMESNRSKNRRNKSHFKQKAKQSTESIGENQLPSPTDRVRSSCLTTPVNSVGNIVDMQGSLDQENLKKSMCNDKNTNLSKSPAGSVEDLSVDENISNICKASRAKEFEQVEEYVNAQGVRFMPHQQLAPYGALCVRELFRFLVSLCCPHDKQNNEVMTHLGLSLLQVALEIAADYLSNFPSLLVLVKDDLCRNLILLLGTDRLSILAADLQVSFLLFESQREHLKFQMELHMNRLMELVSSDSNRISYDQRELALDAIVRSWRIPGLPAELYLNYDCGLYSTNLYEELMKLFSKNMQFVSLDAIFTLISEMEIRCKGYKELCKPSRHSASANLPTREELLAIKANKRTIKKLYFCFLAYFSTCLFLLSQPFSSFSLSLLAFKKVIQICISYKDSNGRPFASADAAFTLAYAVIMLNVDQHNYNVKRQNNPMTADEFKRNLKKVNGGADFDQGMLDEIYASIKGIGPESFYLKVGNCGEFVDKELAEQAWAPIISALCRAYDKVPDKSLQRRVAEAFHRCASISAHYGMSSDLDTLVVSLCKFTGLATGGEPDQVILHLGGSSKCQLAARTLFKITHIHGDAIRASWKNIIDCLQSLYKARLLPKSLTEGEDFISPTGKVSLLRQSTVPKPAPVDQGILSSLYSYIALDTSRISHPMETTARKRATEFVGNCYLKQIIVESKFLQVESLRSLVGALVFTNSHDEDISVFLLELLLEVTVQNRDRVTCIWPIVQAQLDGLLTTAARENHPYLLERVAVGMLRLAIRLLRGEECACTVLPPLLPLAYLPSATSTPLARQIAYGLFELLKTGAANIHSTEDWKVVFSLLECAGAGALLPKQSNTVLDEATNSRTSMLDARPISPVPEWVLASPTGTEAPLPVAADTIILDRDLQPHDPAALVKCCESLTFLIRDMAHVTPFNFELCIRCVRTFAEAVLQCSGKRNKMLGGTEESVAATYQQSPIRLLDLMLLLHTRIAQVFRWWAEEGNATENISLWPQVWRPLSQGIARLCCDARRQVRTTAITYLQSTLLAHDLAQLSAVEWSQCLEQVLFPLLAQLLGPIASNDPIGVEETRVRAAMLLSKVFLHHLNPLLTLPGFLPLWLTVLSLLRAYMHADNSELLFEAIPESLKNMLLVMSSANVLAPTSNLWAPTWRTIDAFLPTLKAELFPEPPVVSVPSCSQSPQIQHILQVISLIEQQQPCFSGSIAPLQPKAVPAESKSVIKDNTEDERLSLTLSKVPVEESNCEYMKKSIISENVGSEQVTRTNECEERRQQEQCQQTLLHSQSEQHVPYIQETAPAETLNSFPHIDTSESESLGMRAEWLKYLAHRGCAGRKYDCKGKPGYGKGQSECLNKGARTRAAPVLHGLQDSV
ncbi:Golgi-specific brefeldin A-resistance guanine nucleotide exchange factor 1 [Eufriesea mexicana]|uniref:Golgi-specific brefeldin A-resistance guanine nucleotide exchange factor 1 n=1 Tax=Eufriesea mexicana TaxID=516756 RepID=A0A310STZ4_9HYME|nr:Golgi-specific brefeldin A-resistance guanine nucleotide exchange factor 1 [Eufriesea mexicana]